MPYPSAFFDGVRRILTMTAEKDQRPMRWLFGLLGSGARGVDPIEARHDFGRFSDTALRSGPLRADDVWSVNDMIFLQQRGRSGLAHYDSRTGLQWDWDGSPVVHALVCTLGRDAARRLDDKLLYDACAALEYQAYCSIATTCAATMSDVARLAQERADRLRQRHDIDAALAAMSSAHERSA